MKVEINYLGILFRVIFFLLLILFTSFIIRRNFIDEHHSVEETQASLAYLFFVACIWIWFIVSFRGIFKVVVDEGKSELELSFLFRKKRLEIKEIEGYYLTRFWTRMGTVEGIILKTYSAKFIHLNEFELDTLFEFNQFLISNNIPFLGKTFSMFYPFRVTPK